MSPGSTPGPAVADKWGPSSEAVERWLLGDASGAPCAMSISDYDASWVARAALHSAAQDGRAASGMHEHLLSSQHEDGSWGSSPFHLGDRLVSTLAALLALDSYRTAAGDARHLAVPIERAVDFAADALCRLTSADTDLVAFELLVPRMRRDAGSRGYQLPADQIGLDDVGATKLALIPSAYRQSPTTSLAHSLECWGEEGPRLDEPETFVGPGGSVGCSPAASAYLSIYGGSASPARAQEYLAQLYNGSIPWCNVHPFRTFELYFSAYPYLLAAEEYGSVDGDDVGLALREHVSDEGARVDPEFPAADGDHTAVVLSLLAGADDSPPLGLLDSFWDDHNECVRTFAFERNLSVSTNGHALHAWMLQRTRSPHAAGRVDALLATISVMRSPEGIWCDKWHLSPYYATGHVVCALTAAAYAPAWDLARPAMEWLVATQRPDGGWGILEGTSEETSYAALALCSWVRAGAGSIPSNALQRALDYLVEHGGSSEANPLWIGKVLYDPVNVRIHSERAARLALERGLGA